MTEIGEGGTLDLERLTRRGWREEHDRLVLDLMFRDFPEAVRFVDRLAESAVDYNRRPDVSIVAGSVQVEVHNRHHVGITLAELRLASKVDAVVLHDYARPDGARVD